MGETAGYRVYKNLDGFMEGYRTIGKNVNNDKGTDIKRVVTNQTTMEGFALYINGMKSHRSYKDVPLKPHQLPSLFNDE